MAPPCTLARLKKSYGPLFGFIPKEEIQKVCQLSVTELGGGSFKVITFIGFKKGVCNRVYKKGYLPPLASIQKPRCKCLSTSKCDLMMILITPL